MVVAKTLTLWSTLWYLRSNSAGTHRSHGGGFTPKESSGSNNLIADDQNRMAAPNSSGISHRRVALVTGASRGIGRAIAIELGRVNYDVMINYAANQAAAEEARVAVRDARADEGARVATCRANVAEASDREELLQKTRSNGHDSIF